VRLVYCATHRTSTTHPQKTPDSSGRLPGITAFAGQGTTPYDPARGRPCSQKTKLNTLESLERGLAGATQWAHRHHKAIAGAVVALLLGTGVTAFGVAPLAPDAADLPKRVIAETVTPSELDAQIDALSGFSAEFTRNDLTRTSDTADSLLSRLGVVDASAAQFLRTDPVARRILQGRAG
jgi:hypothetical protein